MPDHYLKNHDTAYRHLNVKAEIKVEWLPRRGRGREQHYHSSREQDKQEADSNRFLYDECTENHDIAYRHLSVEAEMR